MSESAFNHCPIHAPVLVMRLGRPSWDEGLNAKALGSQARLYVPAFHGLSIVPPLRNTMKHNVTHARTDERAFRRVCDYRFWENLKRIVAWLCNGVRYHASSLKYCSSWRSEAAWLLKDYARLDIARLTLASCRNFTASMKTNIDLYRIYPKHYLLANAWNIFAGH